MSHSGSFGINPNKAYAETPAVIQHTVLKTGSNTLGDWIFAQASGALTAYAVCKIDETGQATELDTTGSGSEPTMVGVPQVDLADNEYGWFFRGNGGGDGKGIKMLIQTGVSAGAVLTTTATAGEAGAGGDAIQNVTNVDANSSGSTVATEIFCMGLMSTNV